jgi:hypothetical protein
VSRALSQEEFFMVLQLTVSMASQEAAQVLLSMRFQPMAITPQPSILERVEKEEQDSVHAEPMSVDVSRSRASSMAPETESELRSLNEKVLKNYKLEKSGELFAKMKNVFVKLPFTVEKVKRIIEIAFKEIQNKNEAILKEDDSYIISKFTQEGLSIYLFSPVQQYLISKGATALIYKILNVTLGIFEVFKHVSNKIECIKEFEHECKMLQDLNPKGEYDGFQKAPTALIDLVFQDLSGKKIRIYGYITSLYKKDLFEWLTEKHTELERIECCKQIFEHFYELWAIRKVHHADLKPENILIDEKGIKTIFRIADFGTATYRLKTDEMPLSFPSHGGTLSYRNAENALMIGKATKERDVKAFDLASECRDLYALGTIFFLVLTGIYYPYKMNGSEIHWPDPSSKFDYYGLLKGKSYPAQLISTIQRMVDQHPEKNTPITIEEVREVFNSL